MLWSKFWSIYVHQEDRPRRSTSYCFCLPGVVGGDTKISESSIRLCHWRARKFMRWVLHLFLPADTFYFLASRCWWCCLSAAKSSQPQNFFVLTSSWWAISIPPLDLAFFTSSAPGASTCWFPTISRCSPTFYFDWLLFQSPSKFRNIWVESGILWFSAKQKLPSIFQRSAWLWKTSVAHWLAMLSTRYVYFVYMVQ